MKVFNWTKVEYHSMNRYFEASITENDVRQILDDAGIDEEEHEELIQALADENHPRYLEAYEIVNDSQTLMDSWENTEDDLWTDRKGGYDVEIDLAEVVDVEEDNSKCWTAIPSAEELEGSKEYKIQIFSRGVEIGIGSISKAQYDHWIEREDDLSEALNQHYDYEENETPEEARFDYYYNEYSDVCCAVGPTIDNSHINITCDGEVVYDMPLSQFLDEVCQDGTDDNIHVDQTGETYLSSLEPGYYVYWALGGKGEYFVGTLKLDEFDPKLLKFETHDVEGLEVITHVVYDNNTYVDDEGGSWDYKWSDYSLHEIE